MAGEEQALGQRLREALEAWIADQEGGYRQFSRKLRKRGIRGSSRPTINSYMGGHTFPTQKFLDAAAEILGVRREWLILGQGRRTEEEEAAAERERQRAEAVAQWRRRREEAELLSFSDLVEREDRPWLEGLEPGDSSESRRRLSAVLHFGRQLLRAEIPGAPWEEPEDRQALLRGALHFVRDVELARMRAAGLHPEESERAEVPHRLTMSRLLVGKSHSEGWNVTWLDATLALFALAVPGLGIRLDPSDKGFPYDSHQGRAFARRSPRLASRDELHDHDHHDHEEEDQNGET